MRMDEQTRGDFPILSRTVNGHRLVYLDSAASSQKPRAVLEAMAQYYTMSHANVHRSIHTLGEEATELYEAARDRRVRVRSIPLTGDGLLDLEVFERMLSERTKVVAFTHVSNVLGTITPVAQLCRRARAAGAVTVIDGAQAAPHLPIDMSALGCDLYVL